MPKKKMFTLSLFVLFLISVGTLLYFTFDKRNRKQQILAEISHLPDLSFQDIQQDNEYSLLEHIGQQALCLIQIDPDCYFCHEQVKVILDKYEHFDDVHILFISPSPSEKLEDYGNNLHLEDYPKIRLLRDKDMLFPKNVWNSHYTNDIDLFLWGEVIG